jgi:hypothetical protein
MDLKEFFGKQNREYSDIVWINFFKDSNIVIDNPKWNWESNNNFIQKKDLGLFFWERGGKQFVSWADIELEHVSKTRFVLAEEVASGYYKLMDRIEGRLRILQARDFLDCLACLGEKKVKELIKGCVEK